ncbi:MAG TPA: OB-fold nucleic acid binding domain-containing protein, partial [Desulfatiglandales bacterium]
MLLEERQKKMDALKEMGVPLYPAGYRCDLTISEVIQRFGQMDHESLEKTGESFSMAGRIMALRDFGKACFVHIKDRTGKIQAYIRKDRVGEESFRVFKLMDVGDFVGIKGSFFRTKTG